jgi:sulfopropanediol 3-dehydrogenase
VPEEELVGRYLKRAAARREEDRAAVQEKVRAMLADIAANRDEAVRRYARELDGWEREDFRVSENELRQVRLAMPETFKEDFAYALARVREFARRQRESLAEFELETEAGIWLGQKLVPVEIVGCYVPGGRYPLISAAIMSVGTAREAGVSRIVACAPPRHASGIYAPQLYALHAAGADDIFVLGGVQALGSMAYGCLGMPAADLITGPGNAYVAEAKRQLFGQVGIDLPAGPTEICVIADETADPALVAIDLLGQAEHGPDTPVWLVTTSETLGNAVIREAEERLPRLPTAQLAGLAWRNNGEVVVVDDDEEAVRVTDAYAPEHVEIMTANNQYFVNRLKNYGSLFVGEESTVAYGDKGVGTNHTLPTGRAARYTGGLWVGKFIKTVTYQRLSREASRRIAPIMGRLCEAEGMLAHKLTTTARYSRYAPNRTGV